MDFGFSAPIPPASNLPYFDGICHADLWLWDSWTCEIDGELSLFTLALARADNRDNAILPAARNDFKFHIRRFASTDDGRSWHDCGAYLSPSDTAAGGILRRNVWSGCATPTDEKLFFAFTGVRQPSPERPFLQSLCAIVAPLDLSPPDPAKTIIISDPYTDYTHIRDRGYYLGPRDQLGDMRGEEGGPILAWRDPFLFANGDGTFDAFWAAKIRPVRPAVGHARLVPHKAGFDVELCDPVLLPDDREFTQAEVPKVYRDKASGSFCMLVSTCNRMREGQPDHEVTKELRLYRAKSLTGPWHPFRHDTSILSGLDGLFGASLTAFDIERGQATLIGPYTEMVAIDRQLTFAPPTQIDLNAMGANQSAEIVSV